MISALRQLSERLLEGSRRRAWRPGWGVSRAGLRSQMAVMNLDVLSLRDRVAYRDGNFATFGMAGRLR